MRRAEIESWTSFDGIAPALRGGTMSLIAHCCLCAVLAIGCSDDAKEDENDGCPGDASVCPDGSTGAGRSGSGGSSTAGRSGSGGTGTGTSGSGTSGTGGSAEPDQDAAAEPQPDAGTSTGDLPMDGTQLSACNETADCTEDRVCYQPGAQQAIGYCTGTCGEDADCAALGDGYTCNAMGGGGMGMGGMSMGMCRLECEGTDDTSCPSMMSCVETVQGSFRCAYLGEDPAEPGAQDMQLWEPCEVSTDCVEGLICYPSLGGGGPGGGGPGGGGNLNIGGFCTQPCETDDECTEAQPSGDIAPTCGSSGGCRFDCSEGGTCPDGMECEMQGGGGGGTARCLYPTQ